ncbi:MAG: hypothetical protein JOY51_07055, partial [Nevskia sp.]|nr:hypothetical protein [Nevskia sp.]
MHNKRLYGAAGLAALALAACDHTDSLPGFQPIEPSWNPVSLATLSDAERELGNIST